MEWIEKPDSLMISDKVESRKVCILVQKPCSRFTTPTPCFPVTRIAVPC